MVKVLILKELFYEIQTLDTYFIYGLYLMIQLKILNIQLKILKVELFFFKHFLANILIDN